MNREVAIDDGIYKAGDVIIDTLTGFKDGVREVVYYFTTSRVWRNLKDNATVWLDGKALGDLTNFTMRNGPDCTTPWVGVNTITFRNVPGTIVRSRTFNIVGLLHVNIEGDILPMNKFQTGRRGFHAIGKIGANHGFEISVRNGGSIKMKGFEGEGGFSIVRLNGENVDCTVESGVIEDFYMHDSYAGEGFYIGNTKNPPYSRFNNLTIRNGYLARTAGEAIQVQHMIGNATIYNIQAYCSDVRWMNMFQGNQSSAIQWCIDGGVNKMHHLIVDGFCQGMICQGGHIDAPEGSVSEVSDVLFMHGFNGMYLHTSMSKGVKWIFERVHYRNFSDMFFSVTGNRPVPHIISDVHGSDNVSFKDLTYDSTKVKMFESDPDGDIAVKVLNEGPVKYANSGFSEAPYNIRRWHQLIGGYHPICKSGKIAVPTQWQQGEIAIDADEVNQRITFHKCITTHTSTEVRPFSSDNFIILSWDDAGVRSDQVGYNGNLVTYHPPDDLRVIGKWKELGVPYREDIIDQYIIGNIRYTITGFEVYTDSVV